MFKKQPLPDSCYHVSSRAIIYDARMRILVIEREDGSYTLPGGDWDFKEPFEKSIRKAIKKQLGAEVLFIGRITFNYRARAHSDDPWSLRLCAPVLLKKNEKLKLGQGIANTYFIDRPTFMNTTFARDDGPIKEHVNDLWLPVEKKPLKR